LIEFRNVKGQKELQHITINETSLAKEHAFNVEVERLTGKKGTVTTNGKVYNYEVIENKGNVMKLAINGQLRKQ
jgi:hypothetical protein